MHKNDIIYIPLFVAILFSLPVSESRRHAAGQAGEEAGGQGCGAEPSPATPATPPLPPPNSAVIVEASGDLRAYLAAVYYGSADDERWWLPTAAEMFAFEAALSRLIAGDVEASARMAWEINFQLVRFSDSARGEFYVLREEPAADGSSPGGVYVWRPRARYNAVIEVPHPVSDIGTDTQGIELFLHTEAAALLISGTHRRSDPERSTCDGASGNDYRRSDPAHSALHLFQVAHEQLEDELDEPLFIQLHGLGDDALQELCGQCAPARMSNPGPMVNISEAVSAAGEPRPESFAHLLAETVDDDGTVDACLYNRDTSIYGGTLNVQGRYTNGASAPCGSEPKRSSGRFIHLEQSKHTRGRHRALINGLVADALAEHLDDRAELRARDD